MAHEVRSEPSIEIVNRQRLIRVDRKRISELAVLVLQEIKVPAGSLTIGFVRDERIRILNRDYRGKDYPTDVLSFPEQEDGEIQPGALLGDILISTDTAVRQALESQLGIEREIDELVIHGILHLCGYDHATDHGEMDRLELRLRKETLDAAAPAGDRPRKRAPARAHKRQTRR